MQRKTVMVREYTSQHDFHTDEQKLSREGWSIEPTVNQAQRRSLLERIRARFARQAMPATVVVTYTRHQPA